MNTDRFVAESNDIVEHLVEYHEDSVELLARLAAMEHSRSDKSAGSDRVVNGGIGVESEGEQPIRPMWTPDHEYWVLSSVSGNGLEWANGSASHVLQFAKRVSDHDEFQAELVVLCERARTQIGASLSEVDRGALTSLEREQYDGSGARFWFATVASTRMISPTLREITIQGDELRRFPRLGPEQSVYTVVPRNGQLRVHPGFKWSELESLDEADRPVGAYYTIRARRPEMGEVDLWCYVHGQIANCADTIEPLAANVDASAEGGHGSDRVVNGGIGVESEGERPIGYGSRWAQTAQAGSPVALWGPRRDFDPPSTTRRLLLIADETGLAGVAAIIESAPDDWSLHAALQVDDEAHQVPLPAHPDLRVTWLHRRGPLADDEATVERHGSDRGVNGGIGVVPEGERPIRHIDQLTAIARSHFGTPPDADGTTPEDRYAWGGAESRTVSAVRKMLRKELGLAHACVSMTGYWRATTEEGR
jgi:NADPH-dependent ferric siderophore reductase